MNTPKIRFKGFKDDWEQRKVSDITNSYSGGTPKSGTSEYYDGNIPFIRSGEIYSDKTELFISELGMNYSSAKRVHIGDILYALYGATSGEVSRAKLDGAINQAILAIIPNQDINADFLVEWFRKEKDKIINTYLQGGQGNLSAQIIKELVVMIPSKEEQYKLGNYFTYINRLITLHQRKCCELKKLKQYMANHMFVNHSIKCDRNIATNHKKLQERTKEMGELESVIEQRLIDQLCGGDSQWTYRKDIRTEEQLWDNFKYILEQNNKAKLNDMPLSESEFAKIKNDVSHASFYDAGKWQVGENGKVYVHVQRGNETLHLVVMNNEHIAGGTSVYEVINQYQAFKTDEVDDKRDRRFDVTLLINGIPMIHIELKNKDHSYMDGYRQIEKYISEGKFRGLFSNIQMFVVSNAVDTKYFAAARAAELAEGKKFITGWVDNENYPVCDYLDFAKAVLRIPQAHEMIAKYTVLDNEKKKLLILRPYQIHAIEAMRAASKRSISGYIWHTTGS